MILSSPDVKHRLLKNNVIEPNKHINPFQGHATLLGDTVRSLCNFLSRNVSISLELFWKVVKNQSHHHFSYISYSYLLQSTTKSITLTKRTALIFWERDLI